MAKLTNLKLKMGPKQLLGSLPSILHEMIRGTVAGVEGSVLLTSSLR
jgi:hypothetical protein